VKIAATLDARQATAAEWDVVVVGSGPAGAVFGKLAVDRGLRVLLVDRRSFPRDKVCGGCLSARTLAELDDAGLAAAVEKLGGGALRRLRLGGWNREVELELPRGLSVSRGALDAALVRAAIGAGAHFLPGCTASLGALEHHAREVELRSESFRGSARGAVVVDASGLGGILGGQAVARRHARRSRVGCSTIIEAATDAYCAGTIHMAVGPQGYVGAARLEDGRLNIAAAFDRGALRGQGAAEAAADVLRQAGFAPLAGLDGARWNGTPPLCQRPRRRAATRLFAVGDAAGYVEPFTGEGMGWAVRSAALLVPLAQRGVGRWSDDLIGAWDKTYRRGLGGAQRACGALAWVLARPLVARGALRVLQRRPSFAIPVVRHFHAARLLGEGPT